MPSLSTLRKHINYLHDNLFPKAVLHDNEKTEEFHGEERGRGEPSTMFNCVAKEHIMYKNASMSSKFCFSKSTAVCRYSKLSFCNLDLMSQIFNNQFNQLHFSEACLGVI